MKLPRCVRFDASDLNIYHPELPQASALANAEGAEEAPPAEGEPAAAEGDSAEGDGDKGTETEEKE